MVCSLSVLKWGEGGRNVLKWGGRQEFIEMGWGAGIYWNGVGGSLSVLKWGEGGRNVLKWGRGQFECIVTVGSLSGLYLHEFEKSKGWRTVLRIQKAQDGINLMEDKTGEMFQCVLSQ